MMGRLSYATPTEHAHWMKKGKGLKFSPLQAVVLALGKVSFYFYFILEQTNNFSVQLMKLII
jgi:hypothetical protein